MLTVLKSQSRNRVEEVRAAELFYRETETQTEPELLTDQTHNNNNNNNNKYNNNDKCPPLLCDGLSRLLY